MIRQGRNSRRRGFSLVEMLLVLVILATLAAIVIPRFAGRSEQAKVTAAETQITSISTALDSFEVDNGFYPPSGEGLTQLTTKPDSATNWRGPYLKQGVPNDPWGAAYVYEFPGKNNEQGYDLSSLGPDGRAGTDDDIKNWK
ncbi:type II secretion system protein GspG [bacterium]|nr:type II secretion system protein GspG [bacterium]